MTYGDVGPLVLWGVGVVVGVYAMARAVTRAYFRSKAEYVDQTQQTKEDKHG